MIQNAMPNTKSAKKALRSSARKRQHNFLWKKKIKDTTKSLDKALELKKSEAGILNTQLSALQKVLDKASKEKVIHKNKADRIKSRYARKIAAHSKADKTATSKSSKSAK